MPTYDFSTLSPHDFELLTRDLLQCEWNVHLESFRSGRDLGIDLRYAHPRSSRTTIIQCKHYHRSGFAALERCLRVDELPKLAKLKPTRYVLSTSVSLTTQQKNTLHTLLSSYCPSSGDIFGQEDINNLLGKHPSVEQRHFKLWLPSTGILERLLRAGIFTQSALEIEDIKRHLSLFVPTDVVGRGQSMLEKRGFCMLTGIPGIGKTTTARLLVATHVSAGWEAVFVANHIDKAFEVFNPAVKQIFLYDDFLGTTSLDEKLAKNEDKQLLHLIRACHKNPETKRLVLTTREYLLEQARRQHEALSRFGIDIDTCTVTLGDYSDRIRAQILVNHLYFYGIAPDICADFVSSGCAKATLRHRNYNPRIIETMCELQQRESLAGTAFREQFVQRLDSPSEIWAHAFENQLSIHARHLMLVFALHGDFVLVEALKQAFWQFTQTDEMSATFESLFRHSLEELEGCFVTIHPDSSYAYVTFHNPSVKDFTDEVLRRERRVLETALVRFTDNVALSNAALHIIAAGWDDVNAEKLCSAAESSDSTTATRVTVYGGVTRLVQGLDRATILKNWLAIGERSRKAAIIGRLLDQAERFVQNADNDTLSNSPTNVVQLYSAYLQMGFAQRRAPAPPPGEFVARLVEFCREPDDLVSLHFMAEGIPRSDELRERIRERLLDAASRWVEERVEETSSSENAWDAINSFLEAAKEIGVREAEFDLSLAMQRATEYSEYEDAEADSRREDQILDDRERDIDESSVDDILDSLR